MLYIILQIIAFQALFLLVYDLFLKKETFFNYNRAYLLITAVIALILPFIKFPELKKIATKDLVIQLPEVFIGTKAPTVYETQIAERAGIVLEQPQIPIWEIILFIGIALAAIIFAVKLIKIYWLKQKNPKHWSGNILVVNLIRSSAAFSFFNTIFLGEEIPANEKPTIYKHELVHIQEFHTLDLLFFELLKIIFWFNPLVYLYQTRIKELHEYIADEKAVKQSGKAEYYHSLLNQVFDVNNVSFTNTFFKKSLIKKRIAMLQKTKSKQLNLVKYGLLIPMIFAMLIYTSAEVRAQDKIEVKTEASQDLSDELLIKKYYQEILKLHDEEGDNHFKIQDKYNYSSKKYIPTKDEYLRYVAYIRYMGKTFKAYSDKTKNVNNRQKIRYEEMMSFNDTFDEHLEYLKSKEAIKSRNNSNYNRTLQVISKDIDNLTAEEHKDAFEKVVDVLNGRLYRKLQIRDADETVEITKTNYDAIIRFFSTEEIKILLNYVNTDSTSEIQEKIEVPFSVVDESPTLVGCQNLRTNQERKKCLSNFVNKYVNRNFNTNISDSLSPGRKRVFVQFKIDTLGYVKDIKARGPSLLLEAEAKRVIATLPQFIPGKQKGELVTVPFSLPIVFQVSSSSIVRSDSKSDSLAKRNKEQLVNYLKDEINEKENNENGNEVVEVIEIEEVYSDLIPFSEVDLVPAFKGCESNTEKQKLKNCTEDSIISFVNKTFNTDIALSINATGRQKIVVSFIINTDGYAVNVQATSTHKEFEKEAERVITSFPRFTPGKHKGGSVNVAYTLPIIFQIQP